MITEVLDKPDLNKVTEVCEKLKAAQSSISKFIFEFDKPTEIVKGRHYVNVTSMTVRTFTSDNGLYCYTFGHRTGHPFFNINLSAIKSISMSTPEEITKNATNKKLSMYRKALQLIHPNAWENIRKELEEDPNRFENYGGFLKIVRPVRTCGTIMNRSVFDDWMLEKIADCFEKKADFDYEERNRQYSFRVQGKLGPDNIYRAWYTREVIGGGANWNYLLLNPTTAWFVEKD